MCFPELRWWRIMRKSSFQMWFCEKSVLPIVPNAAYFIQYVISGQQNSFVIRLTNLKNRNYIHKCSNYQKGEYISTSLTRQISHFKTLMNLFEYEKKTMNSTWEANGRIKNSDIFHLSLMDLDPHPLEVEKMYETRPFFTSFYKVNLIYWLNIKAWLFYW